MSIKRVSNAEQYERLKTQLNQFGIRIDQTGPIQVPWFPREIKDIDKLGKNLQKVQEQVGKCHIQFTDPEYRQRRNDIAKIANQYKIGQPIPNINYSKQENQLWRRIYNKLQQLHRNSMSERYLYQMDKMSKVLNVGQKIPQLNQLSDYLQGITGFTVKPVPGILDQREFLNAFAFGIFNSTQYLRNVKTPDYSPEPDIVHEIVGHVPMFADPDVAVTFLFIQDISQRIGIISLGASDDQIRRLGAIYWFTLQFGACRQKGKNLGYGAGIASSVGQIEHFLSDKARFKDFDPETDSQQSFPTQTVQPLYRVTSSFAKSLEDLKMYGKNIHKQIETQYDSKTKTITFNRQIEAVDFSS